MIFQTRIPTETAWIRSDSRAWLPWITWCNNLRPLCCRDPRFWLFKQHLRLTWLLYLLFVHLCFWKAEWGFFWVRKNWKVQTCWPSQDKLKAHFSCYLHLPHLKVLGQHDLWYGNEHKAVKFTGSKCHNLKKKKINWVLVVPCGSFTDIQTQHYLRNCNDFICIESSEQLYYKCTVYRRVEWLEVGWIQPPSSYPVCFWNICFRVLIHQWWTMITLL